jgi:hypothetical protein
MRLHPQTGDKLSAPKAVAIEATTYRNEKATHLTGLYYLASCKPRGTTMTRIAAKKNHTQQLF